MKKLVLGIALVAMVTFAALAQQNCPESDFRAVPIDGGRAVRIVEYLGDNWTVRIPPRIRDLPVTHIGVNAFQRRNLISVTIPNTVTHIERAAFLGNQLTSITIPNSVIYIGGSAQYVSGRGVIAEGAFGDNQLASVTIGNSVILIGGGAFRGNRLSSVTIPNICTFTQNT